VLSSEKETLPIEKCVGKISAEVYYSCPPGYPLLIYGEVITQEHITFLKGDKNELKVLK
jgi:arginine/lysine/ornithine decarboxylase